MGVPLAQTQTGDSVGRKNDHMSEKALESNYVETNNSTTSPNGAPPRKKGFGSKVKRHCARFWWIHLIIFCVIFLIVALCL